jgi:hypothetical protein
MERIREEVRIQGQPEEASLPQDKPLKTGPIRCKDLLRFEDEEFLQHAYRSLLHRMPEPEGLEFWLHKLRRLGWSKVDILWSIRISREGQLHNVPVLGLRMRHVLFKILAAAAKTPILGWILRWCWALVRLPRMAAAVARLERERRAGATEQEKLTSLQQSVIALLKRVDEIEKRVASQERRRRKRDDVRGREHTQQRPQNPTAQK